VHCKWHNLRSCSQKDVACLGGVPYPRC
jgi:hypothetical protein